MAVAIATIAILAIAIVAGFTLTRQHVDVALTIAATPSLWVVGVLACASIVIVTSPVVDALSFGQTKRLPVFAAVLILRTFHDVAGAAARSLAR